ncbi:MAG: prepilin-type N-terminal cleavage/methylation domain-containing protein [Candidatus Woykebacteria bacterium]
MKLPLPQYQLSSIKHHETKKGFTLIELLIVIAIIAILISIGLAAFTRAQSQARDGQRKADIETIRGALEQYYSDNNAYPDTATWVADLQGSGGSPVYLREVPKAPGDVAFCYQQTASGQNYNIGDDLETGSGTAGPCGNYNLTAQD